MSKEQKPHFWIPDEEVQRLPQKPQARPKPSTKIYTQHGAKLSRELGFIKQSLEDNREDDSFAETDLCVFKVEVPEGETVRTQNEMLTKNGMNINVVKDARRAIVSTSKATMRIITEKVAEYTQSGTNKTSFDYIEGFSPLVGDDKTTGELKKKILVPTQQQVLDIQLMLVPHLQKCEYETALRLLLEKVSKFEGEVKDRPYYLSDNTPVVRIIIPSSTLFHYENDSAIYRIESTRFFRSGDEDYANSIPVTVKLSPEIDWNNLPVVCVLDSGVSFAQPLDKLVSEHWSPDSTVQGNAVHGTQVAGKIVFPDIDLQLKNPFLKPRARILDCNIMSGEVPENVLIKRIQAVVTNFADTVKIYNLSANSSDPIEGDEMSILGYELDMLQIKKGVQFVVSAGNHDLWKTESSLADILDDDDSRVAPPADSMMSIVVGTVVGKTHEGSLSPKDKIAPYSRRGPGFTGFFKPDITAYGATVIREGAKGRVPRDAYSSLIMPSGEIISHCGTSFSAPVVAGALAEILADYPNQSPLLGKALLYHSAIPIWENDPDGESPMEDEDLAVFHNLYGRGLVSVERSRFSSDSQVTFVRTGTLNRLTKERITIVMPDILAAQKGRNVARVTVTCLSQPTVDRTKGSEYLGAYVRASLKKATDTDSLQQVSPPFKEGRKKWDVCHHFSKLFSRFNAGDWQVWLQLFSRWGEYQADVPYALVVTIEDMSESLDIYQEIVNLNRYRAVNTLRLKLQS